MHGSPSEQIVTLFFGTKTKREIVSQICGLSILVISGAAVVGWFIGSASLRSLGKGYIPMAANTALAFLLLGLILLLFKSDSTRFLLFARVVLVVVIAVVGARLGEYFVGLDLRVDHWFFGFPAEQFGLAPVGKMAFFTAVTFMLFGLATFLVTFPNTRSANDAAKGLSLVVGFVGLTFSLGYLYGAPLTYDGGSVPMALNTGVCFVFGGAGLWLRGSLRDDAARRLAKESLERAHYELDERIKERTAELRAQQLFLHAVVDASPNAIFVKDTQGRFELVNKAVEMAYGRSGEEILGRTEDEINGNPTEAAAFVNDDMEVIRTLEAKFVAEQPLTNQRTGKTRFYQTVKVPLQLPETQRPKVLGVAIDITDRKEAEQALRESEQRYRLLFESNPQPMWVYDLNTLEFLAVNEAAIFHYGYSREEFLGMTIKDIRPQEDVPALLENIATSSVSGINLAGTWKHAKKDGEIIDVEIISHPLLFGGRDAELVLVNDITERIRAQVALRETEGQLRQSQKLEGVGQLAGGIAHDFNNLLTVIGGYTDLILTGSKLDEPTREKIEEIRKAADRATSLTRQLLAFSRKQVLKPEVLDVNTLIESLGQMLRRLIGEDIELVTFLGSDVGNINADPSQIEQVVINLIVNARDAMPNGGRITVKTANVELDAAYSDMHIAVNPGPYVMLTISDTGCGMDSETRKRIFEPFFTTKEVGRGTGLGLSTIYGIVKQSGGNIWVYSEVGKGATFKIYLPRVDADAYEMVLKDNENVLNDGSETILLVEDEEMVRKLATDILRTRGYHVLVASGGDEAIEICKLHKERIDLILTDVVMPGMNGRKVAESVSLLQPEIRVLYMSGYTDDAIIHHGVLDPGTNFIEKPFTAQSLSSKVREILGKTEDTATS